MRDERTLPFRPLRDLASEARVAVLRSRARRVDANDKTLYVRTDRPALCTNRAAENRTGVEVTARKRVLRFGQISDGAAENRTGVEVTARNGVERFGQISDNSASLLWAGVIAALLTWIAALALCLLA